MLRVASAIEKCGFPTASIVITGFMAQAKLVAKSQGLKNIALAEYPGTMMTDSMEQLVEKVNTTVADNVVKALTQPLPVEAETAVAKEPEPRDIVFAGSLAEVNEHFYSKMWTDGLPVMPPTVAEVEKFLACTKRDPAEVLAVLPHENREATIWGIAVNGVMAGCRPEYMPVLVALAEAVSQPAFRIQDAGTTPGWEPLIIITGPIIKQLDFNCGQGAMRFGRQANTSIGRFLKLFMRNVCGFRIPPGTGDKCSIGQSMNVVLAENEDAAQSIGWNLYSQDRGFAAGDNTVTVMSSTFISPPTYSSGSTAQEHLETIAAIMGQACATYAIFAVHTRVYEPLFMLSPAVAAVLAKDGWSKQDVREYMFKNVRVKAAWLEKMAMDFNGVYLDMCDRVEKGELAPEYCECNDPQRLVKVFPKPESLQILVSGDPDRNQSKVFVQNGYIGYPTTIKIER